MRVARPPVALTASSRSRLLRLSTVEVGALLAITAIVAVAVAVAFAGSANGPAGTGAVKVVTSQPAATPISPTSDPPAPYDVVSASTLPGRSLGAAVLVDRRGERLAVVVGDALPDGSRVQAIESARVVLRRIDGGEVSLASRGGPAPTTRQLEAARPELATALREASNDWPAARPDNPVPAP